MRVTTQCQDFKTVTTRDSSSKDDSDYNMGDNEAGHRKGSSDKEYHLNDSDNKQEDQHQYFQIGTNITPKTKWSDDNNYNNEYDGDIDNNKDDKHRLATRYPTATLRLQGGNGSPQVDIRIEEESKKVPDKNDTVIVEDGKEKEEENDESDNDYSKQGTFGKYTNYGCTSDRTTTDEISTNTKDTVDTNKETETDNSSNQNTRDAPNDINDDKDATEIKLPNEIEALSDRKFKSDELTTYGDAFGPKKKKMMQILAFNTNSIQLDEITSTC